MRVNSQSIVRFAALAFLILVGVVSVVGKLTPHAMTAADAGPGTVAMFTRMGLVMLDERPLSKDGSYTLVRFARPPCNGVLNVVALQRNAEGAGLLSKAVPNAPVRYILDGKPYRNFPTVEYWIARLAYQAGRSIGRPAAPPMLAAYSELGDCALSP